MGSILTALGDILAPFFEVLLDWFTEQIEKPQPGEYVEEGAGDGSDIYDMDEGVPV